MGYNTRFLGEFRLDRPLTTEQKQTLLAWSEQRHEKTKIEVKYPLSAETVEQLDKQIPGIWCQWVTNETGDAIIWDGREKFYEYTEWIRYLIKHFLEPWGYTLNGIVEYQGDVEDDHELIRIKDNIVRVEELGEIKYYKEALYFLDRLDLYIQGVERSQVWSENDRQKVHAIQESMQIFRHRVHYIWQRRSEQMLKIEEKMREEMPDLFTAVDKLWTPFDWHTGIQGENKDIM